MNENFQVYLHNSSKKKTENEYLQKNPRIRENRKTEPQKGTTMECYFAAGTKSERELGQFKWDRARYLAGNY